MKEVCLLWKSSEETLVLCVFFRLCEVLTAHEVLDLKYHVYSVLKGGYSSCFKYFSWLQFTSCSVNAKVMR